MKRRDFLKTNVLGATPLFLMPSLFAQKENTRQVKIAICGLGRYAKNQIEICHAYCNYYRLE